MSKEQGILPSVNGNSWKQGCMQNYRVGLNDNKNIIIAQSWRLYSEGTLECANDHCQLTGDYYTDIQAQLKELIELYGREKNIYNW
jgi:hypothetical protein